MESDPTFAKWRDEGFVWLPERGMGRYPVRENPYDAGYFAKYEAYAGSELGQALNEARLRLLGRWAPVGSVVDVGIGCGQFVEALRRAGRTACGFDVNPAGVSWLREHGWWLDPYQTPVRTATFWDSLEHIAAPGPLLRNITHTVLVSLPIFADVRHVIASKHLRRDEHVHYWTRDGFIGWLAEHGFRCVEHNTMESLAGREDIHTFVLQRAGEGRGP